MPAIPSVNLIVVLVAAAVPFVSGGIYWGVIANPLTKLLGKVPEEGRIQASALIAAFLTRVVAAYVLAIFFHYAGAQGVLAGAAFGLLAWCGFVITMSIGQWAFGQMSWTRLIVNSAESLLTYALIGAVIGAWA